MKKKTAKKLAFNKFLKLPLDGIPEHELLKDYMAWELSQPGNREISEARAEIRKNKRTITALRGWITRMKNRPMSIYVYGNGGDDKNNGFSPALAKKTVQSALKASTRLKGKAK